MFNALYESKNLCKPLRAIFAPTKKPPCCKRAGFFKIIDYIFTQFLVAQQIKRSLHLAFVIGYNVFFLGRITRPVDIYMVGTVIIGDG